MVVVSVSTASKKICIPADRLSNGDKKVLCLFRNGRERLEDDMAIFGADPKRTRSMIEFKMEPREVLLLEDMGHKGILLSPMNTQAGPVLSIPIILRSSGIL